jgi:hypothetical protein
MTFEVADVARQFGFPKVYCTSTNIRKRRHFLHSRCLSIGHIVISCTYESGCICHLDIFDCKDGVQSHVPTALYVSCNVQDDKLHVQFMEPKERGKNMYQHTHLIFSLHGANMYTFYDKERQQKPWFRRRTV